MSGGEILAFADLDPSIQELIRESALAREFSYSPYSNFKVGAAILCTDGTIYRGCNVENASYPAGVCAERTAIVRAVSEGKRKFQALAVVADLGATVFTTPCGICRQTIAEFGEVAVYMARSEMKSVLRSKTSLLLPFNFSFENADI